MEQQELAERFSGVWEKANYINTIMMVDNFLPGFDMEEQIAINRRRSGRITSPGLSQILRKESNGNNRLQKRTGNGIRFFWRDKKMYRQTFGNTFTVLQMSALAVNLYESMSSRLHSFGESESDSYNENCRVVCLCASLS